MPEALGRRLLKDFSLRPVVATEIEFYLHGAGKGYSEAEIIRLIKEECAKTGIEVACAEKERGPDQYEVSLLPTQDIKQIIADTDRLKAVITDIFKGQGVRADFSAKPMRDAPGSGLHVHVHLEDADGKNVFYREEDVFSPMLLHSIGGLLELMNPCMPIFAPTPESYERFIFTVNAYLLCPTAANVPLTKSWGTNNRTVAIRLPSKPMNHKHIEHRVAGSDADTGRVIQAILAGIHYGISNRCEAGEPIYGDATSPQYKLSPLARNLEEAKAFSLQSAALKEYPLLLA